MPYTSNYLQVVVGVKEGGWGERKGGAELLRIRVSLLASEVKLIKLFIS